MSGIYIHIPFCKQACIYCNFHFKAGKQDTKAMSNAIVKEIKLRKNELQSTIQTLYFGGGTPSILCNLELELIVNSLKKHYDLTNLKEFTLEANPDDIDEKKLDFWSKLGVNRLSIGVQSFDNNLLKWMNRSHDSEKATLSIKNALKFDMIVNADIIFGAPDSNFAQLNNDLQTMQQLGVQHLSCYGLTLEDKTAWSKLISLYKYPEPDEYKTAEQYDFVYQFLKNNNWDHYEISNYCRDGNFALHNTNYWKNKPYLGFGPSAHSYIEPIRKWNVSDNKIYIEKINENILPSKSETLSFTQLANEYIMTGLRTKWGIEKDHFRKFNLNIDSKIDKIRLFESQMMIRTENNKIFLTDRGEKFADAVCLELFF